MAKTKADWLKEAKSLGLKMTEKNKIAEIKEAIEQAQPKKHDKAHEEKPIEEKTDVAKAGKRSAKAVREKEEEKARQERISEERDQAEDSESEDEKKGPIPITRPKIERRSKRYQETAKSVEKDKLYMLEEAADLVVKTSTVKFDSSVEIHIDLNVDPKLADQNIRGVVVLPHGTGKSVKVAVFATGKDLEIAKAAGADLVGEEEFLELLKKEKFDFDVLVSTPQMMSQLGRFAKVLGPKGLMPNPKSGTVTKDIAKAVKQIKAGQLEYRVDEQGIIHASIGKVSFGAKKIAENTQTLLTSVKQAKPSSVKGLFVEKIYLTSSMGPSIRLDSNKVIADL